MGLFEFPESRFDRALLVRRQFVAVLLELFLGREDHAVGGIYLVDTLALLFVLRFVGFRFVAHALDLLLGQARRSLDADFLLLARTFILGRYVEDAVRIDIEGHFDLGHTPRCSGNTVEVETADRFVVACHLAFTLQDVDLYRRLVVRGGRENFALAGRDRRVGVDQAREHAAHRLDTQ